METILLNNWPTEILCVDFDGTHHLKDLVTNQEFTVSPEEIAGSIIEPLEL